MCLALFCLFWPTDGINEKDPLVDRVKIKVDSRKFTKTVSLVAPRREFWTCFAHYKWVRFSLE